MAYELTNVKINAVCDDVPPGQDVSDLVAGMLNLMMDKRGVGLAANQVGVTLRVAVFSCLGPERAVLINPVITKKSPQVATHREGCLSYPNKYAIVSRYKRITVIGYNHKWEHVKYKLTGMAAACVQHEIDHLNGITIFQRGEKTPGTSREELIRLSMEEFDNERNPNIFNIKDGM